MTRKVIGRGGSTGQPGDAYALARLSQRTEGGSGEYRLEVRLGSNQGRLEEHARHLFARRTIEEVCSAGIAALPRATMAIEEARGKAA